ncbi:hypothetical protein BOTBODRAFT_108868 [Botryobasidium botryosum FD-172 SS1]|uniref:Ornithine decarboxylase antizyme n=1 Tax=Botryobasidium botryosum (strain FD-172 SS1) TaxID=930990 RepID=A0A067MKP8_BOTB1|nr:hypothetical protein BOTBODRAFT_108868 [Botryobasidium botryosum FD-172 SS1]
MSSPCPTYVSSLCRLHSLQISFFLKQSQFSFNSNGLRAAVGDGASFDNTPRVLAVCRVDGASEDLYYYSTAFSGGPAVYYSPRSPTTSLPNSQSSPIPIVKPIVTGLETPPATPESSPRGLVGQSSQTLDFLTSLFPSAALRALPYAKSVQVSSADMGAAWEGVILSLPGQPKTLYVGGKGAEKVKLRESIVAILDLAEEHLECEAFVIALDKSSPALGDLLHSFMYLGGTIVSEPPFPCDPACILVGIEL